MQEDLAAREHDLVANTVGVLKSLDLPDRYEIQKPLGSGGMGVVVQAHDKQFEELVAIKILHDGDEPEQRRRFNREAQLLAQLNHPNIVKMRSFGVTPAGNPYQVMELLEGESLSDRLKQKRLTPTEFRTIIRHVTTGLEFAHSHGIVHRDIKPSNIFLTTDVDGRLLAKLVDFGIAKKASAQDQTLTATQTMLGSPLYMSPEQIRGNKNDAGSDIYALGCVMYECLTGHPPFRGETVLETLFLHGNAAPQPIETKSRAASDLVEIVMSCLAKEPADRPASYAQLRESIEAVVPQGAISLGIKRPEAATSERRQPQQLRTATCFSIGVLCALTLVSFIVNPSLFRLPAKSKPSITQIEAQREARARQTARMRTEETLKERLGKFRHHELRARQTSDREQQKEAYGRLCNEAQEIATLYRSLGDMASARDFCRSSIALSSQTKVPDKYLQQALKHKAGTVFEMDKQDTWREVEEALTQVIAIAHEPKNTHPSYKEEELKAGLDRGFHYFVTGEFERGKKDFDHYLPMLVNVTAGVFTSTDRRAARLFNQAKRIRNEVRPQTDSDRIIVAQVYGRMTDLMIEFGDRRSGQLLDWMEDLTAPVKDSPAKTQVLERMQELRKRFEAMKSDE